MTYPHFLRALHSRNYRLFFFGQGISLVGNWMNTTATGWLAYELSNSAFVVGLVVFAGQILLLFSPLAGVWGDRVDRRRAIITLQVLCLLTSATLAVVTLTGHVTVGWLIGLAILRGVINAAEFPTRQSFTVELVARKEDLGNAIALGSSLFNVARLIGPPIAGAVIVLGGAGLCFVLDALSFLPIIASLLLMRIPPRPHRVADARIWEELKAGLRYAHQTVALRAPLLMVPVTAMAAFTSSTLAPVFARDIFHGDARTLGHILAAMGAGALVSALYLSSRTTTVGLSRWVARGALLNGLGQATFALSPWLELALAAMVATGMGAVLVMAGCNTLIQSHVADDKRGRVMGLFTLGQAMFPVGSLLLGLLASSIGARGALLTAALIALLTAVVFGRHVAIESVPPVASAPDVPVDENPG
jgi:MFS family permease